MGVGYVPALFHEPSPADGYRQGALVKTAIALLLVLGSASCASLANNQWTPEDAERMRALGTVLQAQGRALSSQPTVHCVSRQVGYNVVTDCE